MVKLYKQFTLLLIKHKINPYAKNVHKSLLRYYKISPVHSLKINKSYVMFARNSKDNVMPQPTHQKCNYNRIYCITFESLRSSDSWLEQNKKSNSTTAVFKLCQSQAFIKEEGDDNHLSYY